jgi:hypothetical protein
VGLGLQSTIAKPKMVGRCFMVTDKQWNESNNDLGEMPIKQG